MSKHDSFSSQPGYSKVQGPLTAALAGKAGGLRLRTHHRLPVLQLQDSCVRQAAPGLFAAFLLA